jgi:hypothetical protein
VSEAIAAGELAPPRPTEAQGPVQGPDPTKKKDFRGRCACGGDRIG